MTIMPRLLSVALVLCLASPASAQSPSPTTVDSIVRAEMTRRQIPGLSLAIVEGGRIVHANGYGVRDLGTGTPVDTGTLFQAGSISKPVTALGILHLVETGQLALDVDVNTLLTSWHYPENNFTRTEKVTLRRLLSHSAGVTVHGFPGYDVDDTVPTLVQVLDGAPPANTAPIRVDTVPGAIWRYSGGGFTIAQQLVLDVTHEKFPDFMQQTVLDPAGMSQSSFEQPQSPNRATRTASGYYQRQRAVHGRWHLYPEMAAAGLWTTASDLARFAIEVQRSLTGAGNGVVSSAMARRYITEERAGYGLGVAVFPGGGFGHNGRDEGFDASLRADTLGHAIAIMINANDDSRAVLRISQRIAQLYGWPVEVWAYTTPAASDDTPVDRARLEAYAGYYELAENRMGAFAPLRDNTGIASLTNDLPDEEFLAIDSLHFGSSNRSVRISIVPDGAGGAAAMIWQDAQQAPKRMPRVAPLPSSLQPVVDPDLALTGRIFESLGALRSGGSALAADRGVTAGARNDFAEGVGALEGIDRLAYLGEERVAGRGIRRHGNDVARVRIYRVRLIYGERYLLAHLTRDNLLTDLDLVSR